MLPPPRSTLNNSHRPTRRRCFGGTKRLGTMPARQRGGICKLTATAIRSQSVFGVLLMLNNFRKTTIMASYRVFQQVHHIFQLSGKAVVTAILSSCPCRCRCPCRWPWLACRPSRAQVRIPPPARAQCPDIFFLQDY